MRSVQKIESVVLAFWLLVWGPAFAVFGLPQLLKLNNPYVGLFGFIYGMFAPALIWFFIAEPILRSRD